MIDVLIVEDDAMFRYAIKSMIDWREQGFNLYSEAINGKQALKIIKEKRPDLVITDISMPIMNGVDLIKEIKRDDPSIKIIVLSSYNDFDFVKDALKFGAEDYLLKHYLNDQDLLKVLNDIRKKIQKDREKQADNELVKENIAVITDSLLKRLLTDENANTDEIVKKVKTMNLYSRLAKNLVLLIDLSHTKSTKSIPIETFSDSLGDLFADSCDGCIHNFCIKMNQNLFAVILGFSNEKSEARIAFKGYELALLIKNKISLVYEGLVATIGLSTVCSNISKLHEYYIQSQLALNLKLYEGKNKIFVYQSSAFDCDNDQKENDLLQSISLAFKEYDFDAIRIEMDKCFSYLTTSHMEISSLKKVLLKLYMLTQVAAKELNFTLQNNAGSDLASLDFIESIESIEQARRSFMEYVDHLYTISTLRNKSSNRVIQKAIDFINQNYCKDISINDIALALSLSPNYLSNIFKQEMGIRIVEYINKVRIDEAKRLLKKTDLKIYEVADKIGIPNASYFSTVFKELTGMKVIDYKNSTVI